MSILLQDGYINEILKAFKDEVGVDYYSLLTDESTKKKYYDENEKKDYSKYIAEHNELLLEVEEILLDTKN